MSMKSNQNYKTAEWEEPMKDWHHVISQLCITTFPYSSMFVYLFTKWQACDKYHLPINSTLASQYLWHAVVFFFAVHQVVLVHFLLWITERAGLLWIAYSMRFTRLCQYITWTLQQLCTSNSQGCLWQSTTISPSFLLQVIVLCTFESFLVESFDCIKDIFQSTVCRIMISCFASPSAYSFPMMLLLYVC